MAKAKVVKSKRGNDLVQATFGPKELAKLIAVLELTPADSNLDSVLDALVSAQAGMRNRKSVTLEFKVS